MNILLIIGIAQALFFCVFLLSSKGNRLSNSLLSFWLVLISFSLFLNYMYETGNINQFPHLIGLDTAFPFLYMPILYFYAKLLVAKSKHYQVSDVFHLIPFLFYFIYVWIYFYSESASFKLEFLGNIKNSILPLDVQISNILKIVQAVIYIGLVIQIIQKHQQRLELNFSYTEKINLRWLKIISVCLSVIYALKFLAVLAVYFSEDSLLFKTNGISDLAVITFVYVIAFYGLKQPDIFAKWNTNSNSNSPEILVENQIQTKTDDVIITSKYKDSNLSVEESQQVLVDLRNYMENQKPYLQNQLTIKDVAEAIQVPEKYVSQVINEALGLNFFNFINEYRVNEVKKRIVSPEYNHLSLLGIALDCGFNSKSSFNGVFKKQTGETPSSYKAGLA
jgi:AraC-like DNA-binding protein